MKRLIYTVAAAALLAGIATIGFTPAQAMISAPDRNAYGGSSATPVHCQEKVSLPLEGYRREQNEKLPHLRLAV